MEQRTSTEHVVDLRTVRTRAMLELERLRERALDLRACASSRAGGVQDVASRAVHRGRARERDASEAPRSFWHDASAGVMRVASIVLVVGGVWAYLPSFAASLAYFTDTEAGPAHIASGLLDLTVTDPGGPLPLTCHLGEDATASIELMRSLDGFPVRIAGSVANTSGNVALCDAIHLTATYDAGEGAVQVYEGSASGFNASDLGEGMLDFTASVAKEDGPFNEGESCMLNIGFDAWILGLGDPLLGGFYDHEVAPVTFTVSDDSCEDDGGGCEPPCDPCCPCGDTYIDVVNENDATVITTIGAGAGTDGNSANGGDGGEGAEGGGDGGDGGDAGTVIEGDSSAAIIVDNVVNSTETTITFDCTCNGEACECPPECDEGADCGEEGSVLPPPPAPAPVVPSAADLAKQVQDALKAKLAPFGR